MRTVRMRTVRMIMRTVRMIMRTLRMIIRTVRMIMRTVRMIMCIVRMIIRTVRMIMRTVRMGLSRILSRIFTWQTLTTPFYRLQQGISTQHNSRVRMSIHLGAD